jgi:hypothetical protein
MRHTIVSLLILTADGYAAERADAPRFRVERSQARA